MLLELIIILVVVVLCVWLLDRYVIPLLPSPLGRVILALIVIAIVIFLLNKYIGLGL